MLYLTVKALHVASVIVWMAGMVASALLLTAFRGREDTLGADPGAGLRRTLRLAMSAGIVATWLLGGWLFVEGGWFQAPWMFTKLAFVLALSALHGVLVAHLKRLSATDGYRVPSWIRYVLPGEVAAVALVAFLVVAKPF